MPASQTIKVRLTIECDFSRQEVYDAIRSRFDDDLLSEKQMDAIWEWLSLSETDVSDAVWGEDEDDMCDKIKDGLAQVISDEGLLAEDEPPTEDEARIAKVEAFQKLMTEQKIPEQEWMRYWGEGSDGWEEVYNAGHQTKGNPLGGERRENPRLPGEQGIFYQTYGNGGGPGGSGGYWAMRVSNGQHVGCPYEVKGSEFTQLEGVSLEFRPQDSWRGVCAAVRIVPMMLSKAAGAAMAAAAALEAEGVRNLLRLRADRLLRGQPQGAAV